MYLVEIKNASKRSLFLPHLRKQKKLYIKEFHGLCEYMGYVDGWVCGYENFMSQKVVWVK